MSRNSEYFFHNAGRVAWFMKWKIYAKLLLLAAFVGCSVLEAIWYAFHVH